MAFDLWAVLVILTFLTLVNALEQRSAVKSTVELQTAVQAHARKSKRTSKRSKASGKASLRGLGSTSDIAGDDNDRDDDDDEEEDAEDKTGAETPTIATEPLGVHTLNSKVSDETEIAATSLYNGKKESAAEPASELESKAEEKKTEKVKKEESIQKAAADEKIQEEKEAEEKKAAEEEAAQKAVEAAKAKAEKAEKAAKSFSDDDAFDEKVDRETKTMTNETQSPALANFLAELRTEVRDYAMPAYPVYLQTKLDAANKKVLKLESELKKKQEGSSESGEAAKKSEEKTAEGTQEKKSAEGGAEKAEAGAEGELSGAALAEQKAGETFALSFFSTIAMLAIIFAMATSEDKVLKNYTWFLMDQVIAIFLAVMYFNAFDSLLNFHALGFHSAVICSILHAVVMIAVVLGAAAALRKKKVAMAILCSAGAHIVSFSSIHAAAGSQVKWVSMSYTFAMCAFGMITILVAMLGIGFLAYTAKRRMNLHEDQEYMEKTEDIENDFAAMALSVVFTMFVRFMITGHHPVDDETEFDHTSGQRNLMGCYAIVALIVAAFVTTFCSKKAAEANRSDFFKRLMTFFTTVATMNVAWAVLYWGEWQFFEALYPGEAIKGRLMFAITMTMLGGLGLFGLSKMINSSTGRSETRVALIALSLVVAWSWELCFDAAMEAMCEGVSHPVGLKIATTLILAAIVLPVYGYSVKPISSKAAEAIGA